MRVALVHDFLVSLRGADRVFMAMCDVWPEADLFTPIYDEEGTEGRFAHRNVHTSFLQRVRPNARTFRALLPLYPAAIESFDLSGYDLVVSSSSAWAHAVLCEDRAVHVCYCHNPFRYAWNERHRALAERDPVSRAALRGFFRRWREWDWIAAQRVDRYLTNSETTRTRIQTYFGRDSEVVHPPVETDRFSPGPVGDHYMVLSELVSHKRIDVAVEAFNRTGLPLVVIGDGPEGGRLRRLAGPSVTFTGRIPDPQVAEVLAGARAIVVTAVEEFGIAAVEALAAGRPVIAFGDGGVRESVQPGVTGVFYERNDPAALAETVLGFDALGVDSAACRAAAERFSVPRFQSGLAAIVADAVSDERPPRPGERPVLAAGLLNGGRRAGRRAEPARR